MKGIIPAAGRGKRLKPLTDVTSKCLLPAYDRPMIFHPLELLREFGLTEIVLVTDKEFSGKFVDLFGDGSKFGVNLTYKVQESPLGIAHAVGLTKHVVGSECIVVALGDNLYSLDSAEKEEIKMKIENFKKKPEGALVFIKETQSPERFGVAELANNGNVLGIEEKPKNPKSKFAVTGLYVYDNTVFEKINRLKPSARGELEITDVSNEYIKEDRLKYHLIRGEWTDAGTFESLFTANVMARATSKHVEG